MRELFPFVRELANKAPLVSPSILAADFANLEREIHRVEEAGAQILHIDVMDGHFVPNISLGVPVLASVRKATSLPLDVHLMITNPEKYIRPFADAGADTLIFHVEAVPEPLELLGKIREMGKAPGLSLNPATPADSLLPFIQEADIVLTMSVNPGFGGQKFIPDVLGKIRAFRKAARPGTLLSIDGGIGEATIAQAAEAGANMFVAGTSVFEAADCAARMASMRALALEGERSWKAGLKGSRED